MSAPLTVATRRQQQHGKAAALLGTQRRRRVDDALDVLGEHGLAEHADSLDRPWVVGAAVAFAGGYLSSPMGYFRTWDSGAWHRILTGSIGPPFRSRLPGGDRLAETGSQPVCASHSSKIRAGLSEPMRRESADIRLPARGLGSSCPSLHR
jgi:hypothetical protein